MLVEDTREFKNSGLFACVDVVPHTRLSDTIGNMAMNVMK